MHTTLKIHKGTSKPLQIRPKCVQTVSFLRSRKINNFTSMQSKLNLLNQGKNYLSVRYTFNVGEPFLWLIPDMLEYKAQF